VITTEITNVEKEVKLKPAKPKKPTKNNETGDSKIEQQTD
jgi:hypothetical protein